MVTLLIVAGAVCFWGFKSGDSRSFQIAKNLDIFNSIVKELDMFYVDTIDPNKTIRTGIESMLYSLDPYTQYFPEDDQSELEQMLKNTYGGIGSIITWNTKLKRSMIAEPYENMPAATVGLKAGDILLEIDGKDLAGKNNQEVSEMLRGQVGTSFKLKVQRPGTEQPLEFDIVRRSIQLPFIPYYAMLDNNIGYINLSTFSGNPSKEFKQAFLDLKKQGITSLVIDLRNNGGGLLDEAVEIANFFLPRGKTLASACGLGLWQTAAQYFFYYSAVALLTGAMGGILNSTQSFMGVILAHFLYGNKDRLTPRKALGCALGFGGVLVATLGNHGGGSVKGMAFMLIASVIFALAGPWNKAVTQHADSFSISVLNLGVGGLALAVLGFAMGGSLHPQSAAGIPVLLFLAFISGAGYVIWALLMKNNPVSRIAVFGLIIPIMNVLLSALLNGEPLFEWNYLAALVLVCIGIFMVNRAPQTQETKA